MNVVAFDIMIVNILLLIYFLYLFIIRDADNLTLKDNIIAKWKVYILLSLQLNT